MTHLDNQIRNIQGEIQNNINASARHGLPQPYTISHIEYLLAEYVQSASAEQRTMSGDAYEEGKQLLRNLKKLRDLKKENEHLTEIQQTPKFEYNYTSIYGTFTTEAETEPQAYSMFLDWLEQKDKEVVQLPEPISDPSIEGAFDEYYEPEPEVLVEEEPYVFTQCSDVYTLDNGKSVKTYYPALSVSQLQNFISQGLMIRECGTPEPSLEEVRSHYGYTVEVEPEVLVEEEPYVFTQCSDVYTLDNGKSVKTYYPALSVSQLQNFISQGLMIRECGTPEPSLEEVRSHYGYTVEVEPEVEPEEEYIPVKPGQFKMADLTNTNVWVGILIAGTLAVPVFSSILSKKP